MSESTYDSEHAATSPGASENSRLSLELDEAPGAEPVPLRLDHRTGRLTYGEIFGDDAPMLPDDVRFAVPVQEILHGHVTTDDRGRPLEQQLVPIAAQPRPPEPGQPFVRHGEAGPRQALAITLVMIDEEPGFRLRYLALGGSSRRAIWRLVRAVLAHDDYFAGCAGGFSHPVIKLRPRSFLSPQKHDVWYFDWLLVDWLNIDGRSLQSEDQDYSGHLAVDPDEPPVPRFHAVAERLGANGYDPVPEVGTSKAPPRCARGWTVPRRPAVWLRATRGEWRALFTGLLTVRTAALDVDVTDRGLADELEALARDRLGPGLLRIGNPPKRLLLYRAVTPLSSRVLQLHAPDGGRHLIEVLGFGRKFTAFALHQTTRRPYRWPDGSPLDVPAAQLPEITPEAAADFLEAAARTARDRGFKAETDRQDQSRHARSDDPEGGADPDEVAAALQRIPNNDLSYDQWIKIGFALKHGLGDAGESLWQWWSGQSGKNVPAVTARTWRSLKPRQITIRTLFWIARHGFPS